MRPPAATPDGRTRPSEAIVRAFLQAVPDLLFLMDRNGVYLDYSARCESQLVAPPSQFLGRRVSDIFPPEHARACLDAIARTLDTGQIQSYEYAVESSDGTRSFEVRLTKCGDDEVLAIVRNVTEQRRAANDLHRSQQRLALHFEQTAIGVVEWNLDFTIAQWNAGSERIFGFSRARAVGANGIELLVPPSNRQHVLSIRDSLHSRTGGARSTNENLTADGRIIICEWFNTPLVDESGRVVGIASLVQDISDRVRAEQQLRHSRENYESLVNTIDGIVWEADPATLLYSFVSQQVKRILGCPASTWLADPDAWQRQIHPDDRARVIAERQQIAQNPGEHRFEYRMLRTDGSVVWLQDSVTHVSDGHRPGRLRGIMVDITDRRRAEAAVRESEARFRRVVDSNLIGVYFWETSGRVIEANDAFLRMLGYTRADLDAGRLNWRSSTPPEFRYLADRAMEQMRHFGASTPYVKEFLRKDGSRIPVLIGDAFLEHSTDRGVGFVLDITERRIAEDRQALMLKELDHRVKNNMMAVLTLTEQSLRAANDTALPPRSVVENLLGRLRALARTHNSLAQTHWSGASLRDLVRQTLEAFRLGDPLALSIEGEEVLLPPRIATVMAMALHELATNALKHGALSVMDGRVSVRWEISAAPASEKPLLHLVWHESGGPPVAPPASRGFGLELIQGGISYESHGRVDIDFHPSGLRCDIVVGIDDPDHAASSSVVAKSNLGAMAGPLAR